MKKWLLELKEFQAVGFEVIRIALGFILLQKGIEFVSRPELLTALLDDGFLRAFPAMLAHYIVFAHVVGGLFLIIGFLTRIVALVNLPVLLGAVFFIHLNGTDLMVGHAIELPIIVLILIILCVIHGSGKWSVDHFLFGDK